MADRETRMMLGVEWEHATDYDEWRRECGDFSLAVAGDNRWYKDVYITSYANMHITEEMQTAPIEERVRMARLSLSNAWKRALVTLRAMLAHETPLEKAIAEVRYFSDHSPISSEIAAACVPTDEELHAEVEASPEV